MGHGTVGNAPQRVGSIDAYRGFVMLAMVSGGFAFAQVAKKHPDVAAAHDGTRWETPWRALWDVLAYQFEHVEWTGCAFWDLIQPSFMFLVGVALPFSCLARQARGDSYPKMLLHVLWRSALLVVLGLLLRSDRTPSTNFTFVDVLAQIGLGYPVAFLLTGRSPRVQFVALAAILGGYWLWFARFETPANERTFVTQYLREVAKLDEREWTQFDGLAARWNKHLNAAASADREFLDRLPLHAPEWNGRRFWVNSGGYQTLNFVPSIATMLLGVLAGTVLHAAPPGRSCTKQFLVGGFLCFGLVLAVDTTIWPVAVPGCTWTLCPTVKRIWTPSWVLFSTGWTLWLLALFHAAIDVRGWRRWAFPLTVVGANSIAMYVMSYLLKPWLSKTLKTHLASFDALCGTGLQPFLFSDTDPYAPIRLSVLLLVLLWLVCLWMYRRRIFLKS
jgi:predicted acyltransferase